MKKLFISYSWNNKEIADEIDESLKLLGISLIRDARDAPNYTSLKNFMRQIRECDYAILLISDSYLRSENCMYEVIEFSKEADFKERILPILLDDAIESRKLEKQTEYIDFWEKEVKRLQSKIACVDTLNALHQNERLNEIRTISQQIGTFLHIIRDIKSIDYNNLKNCRFSPILDKIGFENEATIKELLSIYNIEDFQKREIAFQNYLESYGPSVHYYNYRGSDYYFNGQMKLAQHYYEKAVESEPNAAYLHNNLGNALCNRDDIRAKKEYEKAIELDPDYAEAYDNYANLLSYKYYNDNITAKKYRERALSLNPNSAAIHYNYANTLFDLGVYKEAEREYINTLALDPNYIDVNKNLALTYVKMGNKEQAFNFYKKAINSNPGDPEAYSDYATLIYMSENSTVKDYKYALKLYEKGFELDPNDETIMISYANALNMQKDFDNAKKMYEKLLRKNPNNAKAHSNYAVLLKNSFNDLYKAKEHLEKAIELEPNEYAHHINYANLLSSKPFYDKEKSVLHYEIAKRLGNLRTSKKGKDRNKPCSCGSGLKYKNCCGK